MGIPSYYRKLARSCPRLVQKSRPDDGKRIQWFFMDFNCLIYHCLYRPGAPAYPVEADHNKEMKEKWEADFIETILEYTLSVIREVKPEKGVYLAIDGVVPMAKMRQQRLRRFKSSWMKRANVGDRRSEEKDPSIGSWNTNAITPGTAFMDQLHKALVMLFTEHGKSNWKISSCREWGEGEHKILAEWRRGVYEGSLAIYGLDADLIILSLLGQETVGDRSSAYPVYLFREEMDRGSVQYDSFGQESYEWFSIHELRQWLIRPYLHDVDAQQSFILQYCFMMSFLGNDFLPSSLSYKMRDEGHDILLDLLRQFFDRERLLISPQDCSIVWGEVRAFFRSLAHDESQRILEATLKKQHLGQFCESQSSFHEMGHNDWPLSVVEERVLLHEGGRTLHPKWKERYVTHFFHGFSSHSRAIKQLCDAYYYGIQWVWSYYLGKMDDVCFNWYYPFHIAPLWEWLADIKTIPPFDGTAKVHAWDISPHEQLALVLPIESWSLMPVCPERELPYKAPHLFPAEFSFDSVGKRFFWECESMIPVPSILEVKSWISSL